MRLRRSSGASAPLSGLANARAVLALAALAMLVVTPFAGATADTNARRVQLVVSFADAATAAGRRDALADAGVRVEDSLPKLDALVLSAPAAASGSALAELRAKGDVEYAARERFRKPLLNPNDPGFASHKWPYVHAALPSAWDVTTGRSSVVVAVLDSGVDYAHADLPAFAAGYDFVNGDANPADDHGHGTMVAGALAARLNNGVGGVGACPGCTVMPIKVIEAISGLAADTDIADGIVWATDHGADVLNLSLGGPDQSPLLQDAVNYATSRGVLVVAAAGNGGTDEANYPAALNGVISVGASDSRDLLYAFSNRGATVDLAAPGCIYTTLLGGGYAEKCGTSLAAPIVSGVAGLLLSRNPGLNRVQLESVLTSSADEEPTLDVTSGLVDAYVGLLVAGAMPGAPANTALPLLAGSAQSGQALTATTGTWSGTPVTYTYAWQRCNALGVACGSIPGATSAGYLLSSADVGSTIRVVVTATDGGGVHGTATSATSAVVTGNAPWPPSVKPTEPKPAPPPPASDTETEALQVTIAGAAKVGKRLTVLLSPGWAASAPSTFRYLWQACSTVKGKRRCANLAGRTAPTILVARSHVGKRLRVVATVRSGDGAGLRRVSALTSAVKR